MSRGTCILAVPAFPISSTIPRWKGVEIASTSATTRPLNSSTAPELKHQVKPERWNKVL